MLRHEKESEVFRKCIAYYDVMMKQSQDIHGDKVWTGFVTKLFPAETNHIYVTRALEEMGCIRCVRKGRRNTPSMYHLRKPPTIELFNSADRNASVPTNRELYQYISDLTHRVNRLEALLQKGD